MYCGCDFVGWVEVCGPCKYSEQAGGKREAHVAALAEQAARIAAEIDVLKAHNMNPTKVTIAKMRAAGILF